MSRQHRCATPSTSSGPARPRCSPRRRSGIPRRHRRHEPRGPARPSPPRHPRLQLRARPRRGLHARRRLLHPGTPRILSPPREWRSLHRPSTNPWVSYHRPFHRTSIAVRGNQHGLRKMPARSIEVETHPLTTYGEPVEVELSLLVRPIGLLMLIAGTPSLKPFIEATEARELWVRWETPRPDSTHMRISFVTRGRPQEDDVGPTTIARSAPVPLQLNILFELLDIQSIVDVAVLQHPLPKKGTREKPLHFLAFVESPSYDWSRLQALSDQFRAELSNR